MPHSFNSSAFGDRIARSFRRRRVREAAGLQPSGSILMKSLAPPCAGVRLCRRNPMQLRVHIPRRRNRVKT